MTKPILMFLLASTLSGNSHSTASAAASEEPYRFSRMRPGMAAWKRPSSSAGNTSPLQIHRLSCGSRADRSGSASSSARSSEGTSTSRVTA